MDRWHRTTCGNVCNEGLFAYIFVVTVKDYRYKADFRYYFIYDDVKSSKAVALLDTNCACWSSGV
jgi:hypothetical protein